VYHGPRTLGAVVEAGVGSWLHLGQEDRRDRVAMGIVEAGSAGGEALIEFTYGDLNAASVDVAARLVGAGVRPGMRVLLRVEPGFQWLAGFLGVLRMGAVVVPLDLRLTPAEFSELARRSEPAALLSGPACELTSIGADRDVEVRRRFVRGDEPAILVWTSGTTGTPKGVTLSLANMSYVVDEGVRAQGIGSDDRWLSILPPSHLFELCCGLLAAVSAGSTVVVLPSLLPGDILGAMARYRITRMVVVPMVLHGLRRHLEAEQRRRGNAAETEPMTQLGCLKGLYCGGAPLDEGTRAWFGHQGVEIRVGYGLSEASPTVTMNTPQANRAGSVGRPLAGTEVWCPDLGPKFGGDGEILVRGPGVMTGYWDDPTATRAAVDSRGWLHTGDLGYIDDDGYLFVTGRSKSLIVLDSGKKVQPEEVEACLRDSPHFQAVCVCGLPDANGRDRVGAVIVPAHGGDAGLTFEEDGHTGEVRRLTRKLSGYKRPTVVEAVVGPLPTTAKASVRRGEIARVMKLPVDDRPPWARSLGRRPPG